MALSIASAAPVVRFRSNSLLNVTVCCSSPTRSGSSVVCFRNRSGSSQIAPGARELLASLSVRFASNRRAVGFVKLDRFVDKGGYKGLLVVRADGTAIAESAESAGAEKSPGKELAVALLSLVEESDRGARLSKDGHANVGRIIGQLEQYGIPEPLRSPLIFGDWDVAYSSNPTSPGGGYRSFIGRLIFKTKEMVQGIEAPDVVVNIVKFALFGFIAGQVILRGKLTALEQKLIRVDFEAPALQIGPFKFNYGKTSFVKISIIYLDENLRLGRGSRGTLFVFTRR